MSLSLAIWSRAASALARARRADEAARHLAHPRRLVDGGGPQRIGLDADLGEQPEPARTGAGQDQFGLRGPLSRGSCAQLAP